MRCRCSRLIALCCLVAISAGAASELAALGCWDRKYVDLQQMNVLNRHGIFISKFENGRGSNIP